MLQCSLLPCSTISDHDGLYICINIRVNRFQPRFKLLSNEKQFNEAAFKEDLNMLPFSTVYSVNNPNEKLDILNTLFRSCLDQHAPLRRTKITRPPAPLLNKDDLWDLQKERNQLRYLVHRTHLPNIWEKIREVRKKMRMKIKIVKRAFCRQALSFSEPKELWNTNSSYVMP